MIAFRVWTPNLVKAFKSKKYIRAIIKRIVKQGAWMLQEEALEILNASTEKTSEEMICHARKTMQYEERKK